MQFVMNNSAKPNLPNTFVIIYLKLQNCKCNYKFQTLQLNTHNYTDLSFNVFSGTLLEAQMEDLLPLTSSPPLVLHDL